MPQTAEPEVSAAPAGSVAQILGKVSGLGEETVREIWDNVQANRRKLDNCGFHEFVRKDNRGTRNYVCKNCGGEVDAGFVIAYKQGVGHGHRYPGRETALI
jgi:hypothetical protein